MTREEAREILTHNWTRVDNPNYTYEELDEAFFMAIEALENPKCRITGTPFDECGWCEYFNCETCKCEARQSDLISRADAVEMVYRKYPYNAEQNKCDEMVDALKALPSAVAPKGDLISRQWLLELYGDYIGDNGKPKYHVPLEVVRQNIKDAPSAEAIQGEWVDVENEPYCECSVCGAYIDNLDDDYAFCPRCGARMKGGAE